MNGIKTKRTKPTVKYVKPRGFSNMLPNKRPVTKIN